MANQPRWPAVQLYGRRKGPRLRAHQIRLVEHLLPKVRVDPLTADPKTLFDGKVADVWLEIGFGGGEHLAWQARHNPDIGFIGCEPFINGIAKLLSVIDTEGLTNIRILDGDARPLLETLKDNTLARMFLLYPDPWPKRRHNKRRFVNQTTLGEIHRVLKPCCPFRIASDIPDYIRWTLLQMRRHGGFDWSANEPQDWRNRAEDWPQTRYEAKAINEGRTPCYLEFCPRSCC